MPDVTCPQCGTRQPIEPEAAGYRCLACAASWGFVRCTVCGERFHTRPGTRAWTCPRCGTPHGRDRRGISSRGAPIPLLVGGLLVLVAVVIAAQAIGGDGAETPPPTTPSPTLVDVAADVCDQLSELQLLRVDALGRISGALRDHADVLREQGAEDRATAVTEVIRAIRRYRDVAEGGGDTQTATNDLLDALGAVDWCE
jgi:ssDNA-binding Zn-finger/Zn-ribbon topoisomerase 1